MFAFGALRLWAGLVGLLSFCGAAAASSGWPARGWFRAASPGFRWRVTVVPLNRSVVVGRSVSLTHAFASRAGLLRGLAGQQWPRTTQAANSRPPAFCRAVSQRLGFCDYGLRLQSLFHRSGRPFFVAGLSHRRHNSASVFRCRFGFRVKVLAFRSVAALASAHGLA